MHKRAGMTAQSSNEPNNVLKKKGDWGAYERDVAANSAFNYFRPINE
jgi:hypothetical protein